MGMTFRPIERMVRDQPGMAQRVEDLYANRFDRTTESTIATKEQVDAALETRDEN